MADLSDELVAETDPRTSNTHLERHSVKVAVVGSGLAGILAAYALVTAANNLQVQSKRNKGLNSETKLLGIVVGFTPIFDVHLFESSQNFGLSNASTQVSVPDDCASQPRHWNIDSPMRAVQSGYYQHLIKLYKHLDIQLTRTDFSYSFYRVGLASRQSAARNATFIYEGTDSVGLSPFAKPSHISSWLSVHGIIYTLKCFWISILYICLLITSGLSYHARHKPEKFAISSLSYVLSHFMHWIAKHSGLHSQLNKDLSLAGWLDSPYVNSCWKWCFAPTLRQNIIEPLFCSICSCSLEELYNYPVTDLFDYMWLTLNTSYYFCAGGVKAVTKVLTEPLDSSNIHLGPDGTIAQLKIGKTSGRKVQLITASNKLYEFDQVIFGTQANQLQHLLESCYKQETPSQTMVREGELVKLLGQFKYCKTLVVNHHDPTVLPRDRTDWRDLNFATGGLSDISRSALEFDDYCAKFKLFFKAGYAHLEYFAAISRASNNFPKRVAGPSSPASYQSRILDEDSALAPDKMPNPASHWMSTHLIHCNENHDKPYTLLQTTNPIIAIDPKQIITKTWLNRVLFDPDSRRAFEKLSAGNYQGMNGIWFVGSWFSAGIPLLEGCVTSAESVVKQMVKEVGILADVEEDSVQLEFVWEK